MAGMLETAAFLRKDSRILNFPTLDTEEVKWSLVSFSRTLQRPLTFRLRSSACQVAGPETEDGFWNKHEWIPSIISSSLFIKALPNDLAHKDLVDWTPIERIVSLVLDVAGANGYFHGVNPATTSWRELAPAIQDYYGKDRIPQLVSFQDWVSKLEKSQTNDAQALEKNPGLKLLDFYRELSAANSRESIVFGMNRAQEQSLAMRSATAITPELMNHWCKQWEF